MHDEIRQHLEQVLGDEVSAEVEELARRVSASLEARDEELRDAGAELNAALGGLSGMMLWVDDGGLVNRARAGASAGLGQAAPELEGVTLQDFPDPEAGRRLAEGHRRVLGSGAPLSFECECRLGKVLSLHEVWMSPLRGGTTLIVVRDVTDSRRVQSAERDSRTKSEFLATISHELRTSLHGVLSFARFGIEKTHQGNLEKLAGYFEKIEGSGQTLLGLLDDLLDIAKFEAGKMRFEPAQVDLVALLTHELDQFTSRLHESELTIDFKAPHGARVIEADFLRIGQVVRNLMSNAVKYSPPSGTIQVDVQYGEGRVLLSVSDEGEGVPDGELESIFDKFSQSSLTTPKAGGTGLGLAICREIVAAHGGRIWAEALEPGVRFSVELPAFGGLQGGAQCIQAVREKHAA